MTTVSRAMPGARVYKKLNVGCVNRVVAGTSTSMVDESDLVYMMMGMTAHDPMDEREILWNAIDVLTCRELLGADLITVAAELRKLAYRYKQCIPSMTLEESRMLDAALYSDKDESFLDCMLVFCLYLKDAILEIDQNHGITDEGREWESDEDREWENMHM